MLDPCSPEAYAIGGTLVLFASLIGGASLWDRTKLSRLLAPALLLLYAMGYAATSCAHAAQFLSARNLVLAVLLGLLVNVIIWVSGFGRKRTWRYAAPRAQVLPLASNRSTISRAVMMAMP